MQDGKDHEDILAKIQAKQCQRDHQKNGSLILYPEMRFIIKSIFKLHEVQYEVVQG